jgi:hypothetical protein
MAEPDSILQLGIEAARDGNKEEARNLFRLLTRQEPGNAQAWLWLAGVAENREERQAALEHVVELDPTNEMAVKGLQALGVKPGSSRPAAAAPKVEPPQPIPVASPARADDPFDDDDPFAELDALSDVMADAEAPLRRSEPAPSAADVFATNGAAEPDASSTSRGSGSSSRSSRSSVYDDEETTVPARGPLNPLLLILGGLVILLLIGFFIFGRSLFGGGTADTGPEQTAAANATVETGLAPTTISTVDSSAGTTQPISPTANLEQPTPAAPTAPPQPPTADPALANPVLVQANTPLQSEGWLYDFNQPTYAAPIIGNLGSYQPNNGRFVVVLAFAVNNTGQSQSIPASFFVLKDAQGRVWESRPEVSDAYVLPGVNADLSQNQAVPPDGITRSVALIFDVAPDATNLVFFARSNPTQGWLVLPNV